MRALTPALLAFAAWWGIAPEWHRPIMWDLLALWAVVSVALVVSVRPIHGRMWPPVLAAVGAIVIRTYVWYGVLSLLFLGLAAICACLPRRWSLPIVGLSLLVNGRHAVAYIHETFPEVTLPNPVLLLEYVMLLGPQILIGLAMRRSYTRDDRTTARLAELERQSRTLRTDERQLLAREINDVVVHHVSLISVQVMGHRGSDDPEVLSRTLTRVADAASTALKELRLLLWVLRSSDDVLLPTPEPDLHQTVDELGSTLREHGFDARAERDVELTSSSLSPTTLRTADRVLREAVTNVVHHGMVGSRCDLVIACTDAALTVQVSNPLPPPSDDPMRARRQRTQGLSLMALQERVRLQGGTLTAERTPDYVVRATLPIGA